MAKKGLSLEERVQLNVDKISDITNDTNNTHDKTHDITKDSTNNTTNDVSCNSVSDNNVDNDSDITSDITITLKKRDKYTDLHDRRTYYIFKNYIKKIDQLEKKYNLDKSYIVNEALRYYFDMLEKGGKK